MIKFVAHSKEAISIAQKRGWRPGARYTNLRDVKSFAFEENGFLDIDWKNYSFDKHLKAAREKRPLLTIARDIECISQLDAVLTEAEQLSKYSNYVAIAPKDKKMMGRLTELIPKEHLLAYSVPTKYGGTPIPPESFDRPVHLLGGRPDTQRLLAEKMSVFSMDCNRFTLDARYGDYFDGETFRPHPKGGYAKCLADSVKNIDNLWIDYLPMREKPRSYGRKSSSGRSKRVAPPHVRSALQRHQPPISWLFGNVWEL